LDPLIWTNYEVKNSSIVIVIAQDFVFFHDISIILWFINQQLIFYSLYILKWITHFFSNFSANHNWTNHSLKKSWIRKKMCWINEAKFNSDEGYCETNLNFKEDGSSRIHVLAWSQWTKLKQTTTWDLNAKVEEKRLIKKSSLQSFQNIGNDLNMKLQKATKPILAL
jgi:hypothetical protein